MSDTIQLFKVFMNTDHSLLIDTLNSGFITQGQKVELFESELKKYFNYNHILTLNSATSGLTLALRLINNNDSNKHVLSCPLTCTATNWPILANNLDIKWVDADINTCNMDLQDLQNKINQNTKAIMVVHWAGTPIDINKLHEIRNNAEIKYGNKIHIIHDCAHAFGAKFNNKFIGTEGDIAVYSLQAIKHLTSGDGGLIFLPNNELYERAKLLRWFGISREKRSGAGKDFRMEPDINEWGYKFHMNDINACIGLNNLQHINDILNKHRNNALYYKNNLHKEMLLTEPVNSLSSYWIFTIKVVNKNEFIKYMNDNNVVVSSVHTRNDKHTCVSKYCVDLPNLNKLENEFISIPVGWWLSNDNLQYITKLVNDWYDKYNNIKIIELSLEYKDSYLNLLDELINMRKDVRDTVFIEYLNTLHKFNNKVFLIKYSNEICGTAKIFIEPKSYDNVAHIEDVVINENYRHLKLGSELLKHLIDYSKNNNCYKIVLNCKENISKFYEFNNFIKESNQMVYRLK
jgi:dTDP-4-amino-4,6-dideoxygalactose transaminase/GNAT superfamily N-acetyltransferase